MQYRTILLALVLFAGSAQAQNRDPATLVRDLAPTAPALPRETLPDLPETLDAREGTGEGEAGVTMGVIVVDGLDRVPRSIFAPAIAPFLGRSASAAALRDLAGSVAAAARREGFVFATAHIPSQAIAGGRIVVRVEAGGIDEVRVSGTGSVRLRNILSPLVGAATMRATLERALLLAGDLPGIQLRETRLVREGTRSVLLVEAVEDRVRGYASVDNYGSADVGPIRARLSVDFNGLLADDDVLTMQAVITPAQPQELVFATLRYAKQIGNGGTQLGVSFSVGEAQPDWANWSIKSKSLTVTAFASTPLRRTRGASLWANAEIGTQKIDANGATIQRDSIATAAIWLYGTAKTGRGRISGAVGAVQGIGIGGTTRAGDARASRPDGSARFTKAYAWADWTMPLGAGFGTRLAATGQIASRALLAAQEIGLGGIGFGRAYDFYDLFGDEGFAASAELNWRTARRDNARWLQLYGFVDGGRVRNHASGFGGGALSSGGGGVRVGVGKFELDAGVAIPFASDAVLRRKARLNLSVGRRF